MPSIRTTPPRSNTLLFMVQISRLKKIERALSRVKQHVVWHRIMRGGAQDVVVHYRQTHLQQGVIEATSPIWVCWWQGEAQMPDICKQCLCSVRHNAAAHPVIVIDLDNYAQYVDMPQAVVDKHKSGLIDYTHFADILRCMLLARHGGIWIDATVFVTRPLDSFIAIGAPFWSCHHITRYNNISRGGWTSFFFACGKNSLLAKVMADVHVAWWSQHNSLPVYLFLDYAFAIARANFSEVCELVNNLPLDEIGPMGKCLDRPCTPAAWDEALHRYNLHKLTYKVPLPLCTPTGETTYYGKFKQYINAMASCQ